MFTAESRPRGRKFGVSVHEVLPVCDLAILATADAQELSEWADEFEQLCESVEPLRIRRDIQPNSPFRIWIRTHRKGWLTGTATYFHGRLVSLETESPIESGTSGGPIVDENGELVSVVSNDHAGPFVAVNLPPWAMPK